MTLQGFESRMKYCECCGEKTHFLDECQRIHFKRDFYRASLVYKSGSVDERTKDYERGRDKENSLANSQDVAYSVEFFRQENQDIMDLYDQIIEEEDDFFFYKKREEML